MAAAACTKQMFAKLWQAKESAMERERGRVRLVLRRGRARERQCLSEREFKQAAQQLLFSSTLSCRTVLGCLKMAHVNPYNETVVTIKKV